MHNLEFLFFYLILSFFSRSTYFSLFSFNVKYFYQNLLYFIFKFHRFVSHISYHSPENSFTRFCCDYLIKIKSSKFSVVSFIIGRIEQMSFHHG